jgi:hypothetical protein
MRVDLGEQHALPKGARCLIRQTAGERGLPRARGPGEHDEPVDRKAHRVHPAAVFQREQREVEEALLYLIGHDDPRPAALPCGIGELVQRDDPFDSRRDRQCGHLLVGPSLEVIRPDDAGEIGRVELGQLLEEVQRIEEDAHHVVQRVEVVDADETRCLLLVVVEVLVP